MMKNRVNKPRPQSPGITISDILFALFKHKWKIVILSLMGIGAGAYVYSTREATFQSNSKLMVRYVIDTNQADGHETKVSAGGRSGSGVMAAEVAILTNEDLITETAKNIGPERLIPDAETAVTDEAGAASILGNMSVGVQRGTNIINVSYQHKDPAMAREVLQDLVDRYFEYHYKIHRGAGDFDFVIQQADEVRMDLNETEKKLAEKKKEAGIISLVEALSSVEAQRAKINADLTESEISLASQLALIGAVEKQLGIEAPAEGDAVAEPGAPEDAEAVLVQPERASLQVISEYQTLANRLNYLRQRQFELELKFRGGAILNLNKEEIARLEGEMDDLVKNYPGLAGTEPSPLGQPKESSHGRDLLGMRAQLAALQARMKMLRSHQTSVEESFATLADMSAEIQALENRRKIDLEKHESAQTALSKARINHALDPAKLGNISFVQRPSAPTRIYDPLKTKIAAGLSVVGLMLGVAMALLLELVVDHRVKRPAELESRFRIPLMMSIPKISTTAWKRHLALKQKEDNDGKELPARLPRGQEPDPLLHGTHFINPYAEAVRDRLGYYFELNNMTHKPKLIALTGLSEGSGTSTLAKGLASAFAEIDDSKVLYLDMHSFQNGDTDSIRVRSSKALAGEEDDSDGSELSSDGNNLFVASVPASGGNGGSRRLATKKFYDLMPKFRASQFDYIIFDMPMLDATSPTPAMAGFMDQVILVLDAQNTDRDLLQQGYADLTRGSADVTCIFNKTRSQAPRWIQGAA